jgi:hypothetical protein
MIDQATALSRRERQVARRLARLFRAERLGRFEARPIELAKRLVDRRTGLIEELLLLEERRRSLEPWTPTELDLAMGVLAKEVECAEQHCLERLAELSAELRLRRGAPPTGLRDRVNGRVLGQG